ncbi:MAG: class I SAM-dependent methyltransferase [Pseudomonadales bacterium]
MTANEEQIEFWNGKAGEVWADAHTQLDHMLAPLSDTALDLAGPVAGLRVLDVGCGCGATTFALAERGASVWGIDISAPMLQQATKRVTDEQDVRFSEADAAVHSFSGDHELVFSRFGVMFFDDPPAAFANLRTALSPQGRLTFLCWQAPQLNPWISVPAGAVQPFLPVPSSAPDPRAPGPFAFSERDYVVEVLSSAGFSNVACEPLTATLTVGRTLDDALEFQTRIGPLSRVLAEIEEDAVRVSAMDAARTALEGYLSAEGLRLDAACWLVKADR